MKKLLLVVGLAVLFFSQSSNSEVLGDKISAKTGIQWLKVYAYTNYEYKSVYAKMFKDDSIFYGGIRLWIVYEGKKKQKDCFDFSSQEYFNVDRCESLKFVITSPDKESLKYLKKNKAKNTQYVKKFIKLAMQDVCEDASISSITDIKTKGWFNGYDHGQVTIKCPNIQANKKRIEEEKKLAKQNAIIQEQEAKAQEEFDSRQKKMDTCKAYGFEAGTEAFGNCIFKLMELELEYAKLENEKLKLEAQAEQAKLNNQAALANSLATQAQAANQDKALRIQQFGLAMQGIANTLQPAQPTLGPRITCNKIGNITHCY